MALRALGIDPAQVEADSFADLRQRSVDIVGGIVTKSGRDRALAIATCGRLVLALVEGEVKLRPLYCRDRLCAACQKRRSSQLAAQLRRWCATRVHESGDCLSFVTLTFPKLAAVDPKAALDMVRRYWRRLSNTKTKRGREFHRRFRGGLRSIEVTWSPAGKARRDGSRVAYSGWHAHLHCILESASVDATIGDMKWLLAEWCGLVGGEVHAQDWQPLDDRAVGQCAKYVVKPLDDTVPLDLARRLARELHGRRLHEAFGTWKGWRDKLDDDDDAEAPTVAYAQVDGSGVSLARLFHLARDKATRHDVTVEWRVPGDGVPIAEHAPVAIWKALRRGRGRALQRDQLRPAAASKVLPPEPAIGAGPMHDALGLSKRVDKPGPPGEPVIAPPTVRLSFHD